jgi:hypothetical protein
MPGSVASGTPCINSVGVVYTVTTSGSYMNITVYVRLISVDKTI